MLNIILFGPPGSGKGTQAKKLAEKYQINHISTGDLFRYEMGNDTELGKLAKDYLNKGLLVPDEVTTSMLIRKIDSLENLNGIIFDGYPRNVDQAQSLEEILDDLGSEVSVLLSLQVKQDEIVKRLKARGEVSGRADDQDESIIIHRIDVYHEETYPVYSYFDAQDKAIQVDGNQDIDTVFDNLCEVIDTFVEQT